MGGAPTRGQRGAGGAAVLCKHIVCQASLLYVGTTVHIRSTIPVLVGTGTS